MIRLLISTLNDAFLSRDPQKRHGARHALVRAIGARLGVAVYNRNLFWPDDQEYCRDWSRFPANDGKVRDRKYVLYSMARAIAHLPGDTVECGVFDGGSSFLMCAAREETPRREHHVFDSFQGLSEPQALDRPDDPRAYSWQAGDLSVPLEIVQRNLEAFDFVRYYPGWIPDRFAEVADRKFSFVHIDVDLYQPTHDALTFFYDRMVTGGVILCDDYGSTVCPGAKQALDEFLQDKVERRPIHLTTGQGFVVRHAPVESMASAINATSVPASMPLET